MRHSEAVETYSADGLTVRLYADTDASNPREDMDNFGRMVCWHRSYSLSDGPKFEYNGKTITDTWDSPGDFKEWAEAKEQRGIVVLPLYLYDHGGITMSTGSFSCPWDSEQVGYIYATREMILANWGGKRLTKKLIEQARALLVAEVGTYDQYLTGEVYGYVITADDAGAIDLDADSCWGFYGREYAEGEAKDALAAAVARRKQKYIAALGREADAAGDVPTAEVRR